MHLFSINNIPTFCLSSSPSCSSPPRHHQECTCTEPSLASNLGQQGKTYLGFKKFWIILVKSSAEWETSIFSILAEGPAFTNRMGSSPSVHQCVFTGISSAAHLEEAGSLPRFSHALVNLKIKVHYFLLYRAKTP